MKAITGLALAFSMLFSGVAAQLDAALHPEKYNLISLDTAAVPAAQAAPETDAFVQLGEVKMHYRIYGHGKRPLILIHGNGGSVNSLAEAAGYLGNDYTVYVTESRCHGQSSDPGEISYDLMAKDTAEFICAMGLKKPAVMGHSDGAIVALALAAEYPALPGAIIACGANSNPATFKPYFPLGVMIKNIFQKDKLNDMMLTLPDFTQEMLGQITCPAYIVSGQFDIMWLTDTVRMHEWVPGSDLAVIRGADHSSYISRDGRQAYALAKPWLASKGF